jgi:hypothetical protein
LKNPFTIQLKKARQLRLNVKSMLVMVFDCEGLGHCWSGICSCRPNSIQHYWQEV